MSHACIIGMPYECIVKILFTTYYDKKITVIIEYYHYYILVVKVRSEHA